MTHIWQQFRTARGAAAALSALLALLVGVLEARGLIAAIGTRGAAQWQLFDASFATAFACLGGGLLALRRGNLLFLVLAWSFVFGLLFTNMLLFFDEMSRASEAHQSNMMGAILYANLEIPLAMAGFVLAVFAALPRRRRGQSAATEER